MISALQKARTAYTPKLPAALRQGAAVKVSEGAPTTAVADVEKIQALFPSTFGSPVLTFEAAGEAIRDAVTVGVILSGGQAPGGHNVVCGLYDALKALSPENVLIGFKGGPSGLLENDFIVFGDEYID
ncbi:MAG: diphosphate--fructose-6-phosphate 1-phosphotransferase, partial [Lentisphaeria bacterium]|nr:diphosphate--fructose-6-phosphate 1-phosphotransferase [Lentisphaeria bacterium]